MNPWLGIGGVLAALLLMMVVLRLAQGRLSAELSRKIVHLSMGTVCLSFPWIFQESWPVLVLAALAVTGLAAVRCVPLLQKEIGGVLGGVERRSLGEFYFPVAVAIVFVLAAGDRLLFVIPVLTLTVADSVGALVGRRYGSARYRTDEGLKSAEGSLAFFTAAFLTCHIPLLLFSTTGRAESLLIGLTAGFVVMVLEAISWRGQDNLIIPVGMFFLLRFYLPLGAADLLLRLLIVAGLVLLVFLFRKRTTLSDSAVLAGALAGYAVWAFGGRIWLLPPLLLFLVYVNLPAFPKNGRPIQNLHAVTRVMAGGFLWILLDHALERDFFPAYFLCLAAHTGNIVAARLRVVRPGFTLPRVFAIAWVVPTGLFGLLALACSAFEKLPPTTAALIPAAVALSLGVFIPIWPPTHLPSQKARIWLSETVAAFLASLLGVCAF